MAILLLTGIFCKQALIRACVRDFFYTGDVLVRRLASWSTDFEKSTFCVSEHSQSAAAFFPGFRVVIVFFEAKNAWFSGEISGLTELLPNMNCGVLEVFLGVEKAALPISRGLGGFLGSIFCLFVAMRFRSPIAFDMSGRLRQRQRVEIATKSNSRTRSTI
jgi:hypothetical protein